jgi:DNA-binding response OmpR family regulator
MPYSDQELCRIIYGKNITIVEDDENLRRHLVSIFSEYSNKSITEYFSIETAMREIIRDAAKIDLLILDVMLPKNDNDHHDLQEIIEEIHSTQKEIRKILSEQSSEENEEAIARLRYDRVGYKNGIESLIDMNGGISLATDLRDNGFMKPIMILSALSRMDVQEKVIEQLGKNSDWVVKPVTSSLLLQKCVNLLAGSE